jgi:tetratricopeptide (TPR) repeat protein
MLFVAGCARPQTHGPPFMPAPADPAVEVQTRLLEDARTQFGEGRYETATRLLRRLIETYPRSPLLPEARWWLARSYDRAGELPAALEQYRLVTRSAGDEERVRQALRRIAELERLVTAVPRTGDRAAVLIPASRLPAAQDLERWVRDLARAGVTAVVLELDGKQDTEVPPDGSRRMNATAAGRLVPVAHRYGLSVFAGIYPRQVTAPEQDPAWKDLAYDPIQKQLRASESLDLFHPSVQQYLVTLCSALAATGVDGILFKADAPGPLEGFGPSALQTFERNFSVKLEPSQLYASPAQSIPVPNDQPQARQGPASPPSYAPEFWRWTGWKARETLKVLDRIRRAVRAASPALHFVLEMHLETVTNPVEALARYSEDLYEARNVRFDSYLFDSGNSSSGTAFSHPDALRRAVDAIGSAERIWIAIPLPAGEIDRVGERVRPAVDRPSLPPGIGLLYRTEAASVP